MCKVHPLDSCQVTQAGGRSAALVSEKQVLGTLNQGENKGYKYHIIKLTPTSNDSCTKADGWMLTLTTIYPGHSMSDAEAGSPFDTTAPPELSPPDPVHQHIP